MPSSTRIPFTNTHSTQVRAHTLRFLSHRPVLSSGSYTVVLKQEVSNSLSGHKSIPESSENSFETEQQIFISGERFRLSPEDLNSVFPAPGSLGDHSNVLPHITLNRNSLPWEREAKSGTENSPWLGLLVFREEERPTVNNKTLSQLLADDSAAFPAYTPELSDHLDDSVSYIDVPRELLENILPDSADLALLAHVRVEEDSDGIPLDEEKAVVIANRLPQNGGRTTVHLVSFEGRYDGNGFIYGDATEPEDLVRIVSFHNWTFDCLDEAQTFHGLLEAVDRDPYLLRIPFKNSTTEPFLSKGYALLPHDFRNGQQSWSFYRGPFLPVRTDNEFAFPMRHSDELLRYMTEEGLLDISYAAAWELGRMLTLEKKQLSLDLANWKAAHKRSLFAAEQGLLHPDLGFLEHGEAASLPNTVVEWFDQLRHLEGVPFRYLVPDQEMLPPESVRFFALDSTWIDCLLDGAFSIGRTSSVDFDLDDDNRAIILGTLHPEATGLLVRSKAIAQFPGLIIEGHYEVPNTSGYSAETHQAKLVRYDKLAEDLMLCIFEGPVASVDFHLRAEGFHFGLHLKSESPLAYDKDNREEFCAALYLDKADVTFRNSDPAHAINISQLATALMGSAAPEKAAEFAYKMIEGSPLVRFVLQEGVIELPPGDPCDDGSVSATS